MARITTVLNQKGGVGKTTTAHALATGLNHRGFKALVIDADPQGNITYAIQADAAQAGLYEALKGIIPAADAIQHTAQGDLISSSIDLAGADMEFTQTGREYLLREVLDAISAVQAGGDWPLGLQTLADGVTSTRLALAARDQGSKRESP